MSSDPSGPEVDASEATIFSDPPDQTAVEDEISMEECPVTPRPCAEPQSPQTKRFHDAYQAEIRKCSPTPSPHSPSRVLGTGLSELSKQLRILQAKNQAQSIEIDRLERQLRILAELQGISVSELRNALQQACEAEAHGELQHRVASLRAELEAAILQQANLRQQQHQHEQHRSSPDPASAHKIANLELRIGELEEIEQKQKANIQDLYAQLASEQETATRMGTMYEQLKNEQIQQHQYQPPPPPEQSPEQQSDAQEDNLQPVCNQADLLAQREALLERANNAEVEVEVLHGKLALSEQQRDTMLDHTRLREAQYRARFLVQEENIRDLEQQLSSLYAGYTLLQEEHEAEAQTRSILLKNLNLADEQVARDVNGQALQHSTLSNIISDPYGWQEGQESHDTQTKAPIISGMLLVRSNGIIKSWKKMRVLIIHSSTNLYHLKVGNDARYLLDMEVAKVEPHHKQPYGFSVYTNHENPRAAVVYAAATSQKQYDHWMGTFFAISTGASQLPNEQPNYNEGIHLNTLALESAALERALENSKHEL